MRMFFPSICWEFVCLQWLQLTQLTNGYGNVPSFGNSATHVEFIGILRRASPPRRVKKFTRQVWVKKLTIRIFLWPFGWWWANWWKIFPILSSEFLVPRLSSWEHFGSWNRIAGTDAQLPVAFLGGTWWNNSWDSARKAHWCMSFATPQTCLELSRTTKNYMVAPLISEGTHQFKMAFMDAPSPPTASFLASKLDRFGGKSGYPTVHKKMAHQDFLICPQDTQNQDVFSLLVNEISVAIYIDVSCRSMRWISLNW